MKIRPFAAVLLPVVVSFPANGQETAPLRDGRPATIDEYLRLGERTRVIAHRGFSARAPENTLAAVRRAIEVGADMVEVDVLLTRDRRVAVIHDDTLDRTTDGSGPVAEHTLEEIRRLDAGSWFGEEFAGEKVPTLEELMDEARGRILLNVEIKQEAVGREIEGGIVDRVLRIVGERGMGDRVIVSSFAPAALAQARQLDDTIRTASLYNRKLHRGMGPLEVMASVGAWGFNLSARRASRRIVLTCHRQGRPVAVYTVNEPQLMRRLIRFGVHAIFTDRPDLLLRVLAESLPGRAAG